MTNDEIRSAIAANQTLQALVAEGRVADVAAALSAGRTRIGTVSVGDFASWAAATGMRAMIEDHAANSASPLRSIALALRDVLAGNIGGIRLDLQTNVDMLGAWVSAGLLSQDNRDAILALATLPDAVSANDVSDALAGGE